MSTKYTKRYDEKYPIWILENYLEHTVKNNDCLEWTGLFNTDGYPSRSYNEKVHRSVFHIIYGYWPEVVRHKCDNIKCISPDHLEGGTHLDNIKDRNDRARTNNHVYKEEVEEVRKLKIEGKTDREIAEILGFESDRRVEHIWLYRVKDRPEYKPRGFINDELIKDVFTLREQGLTYKQIGEELGVSRKKVDHILYKKKEYVLRVA